VAETFRDAFTDDDGTALADHDPDTDLSGGGWRADAGAYGIVSNRCEPTVIGDENGRPGIVTTFDGLYPDGTLHVEIVNSGGASTENVGAVMRYAADGTFFMATINNGDDHLDLWYWDGSAFEELLDEPVTIDPNTEYSLTVVLDGDTIRATVGDVTAEITDERNVNATRYGFRCRNLTAGKYYDLVTFRTDSDGPYRPRRVANETAARRLPPASNADPPRRRPDSSTSPRRRAGGPES
jgi:hypothetical protein